MPQNDADVELQLKGLFWQANKKSRTLIYNLTVPVCLCRAHVDMCLFDCRAEQISREIYKSPASYICLGRTQGRN